MCLGGWRLMERDRLGRARRPGQTRGLRPLNPVLPRQWRSKAIRVAMSEADWERFARLVERIAAGAPTEARAAGITISTLLESMPGGSLKLNPGPLAWMDWEQEKTLRLLRRATTA